MMRRNCGLGLLLAAAVLLACGSSLVSAEPTPAPTEHRHYDGDFTHEEVRALVAINITFAAISFVGSSFIIICFILFKDLRSFAFRLVFYMSLADLGFSIGKFFGDAGGESGNDTAPLCTLQALLISFFSLSSIAWCVCIAHTLYQAVLRGNPDYAPRRVAKVLPFYYAFAWGLPLLLTVLPAFSDSYGDTGAWCWIVDDRSIDVAWRYLSFYVPLWLAIPYNAYVYIQVRRKIRNDSEAMRHDDAAGAEGNESTKQMIRRIIFYPLVLVICFLPATINRLYEVFSANSVAWLTGIHIVFATSLGLGNAFVYGLEKSVRGRVLALICGESWSRSQREVDLDDEDGSGSGLGLSLHELDPKDHNFIEL